jgi:hypothetical protein
MTDGNNPAREAINMLGEEVQRSIIGQSSVVERLIIALLANGNVLVEGLPGLAKTRSIKSLARALEAGLSRIQFTPGLLPSDITGTEVYYSVDGKGEFRFQQGPIFNNLILADEITRHLPKSRRPCSKRWKNGRLRWRERHTSSRTFSWSWPLRTRSSRRVPIPFPRPRWTGS